MRLKSMEVTFLYKAGSLNVQEKFNIEFAENERVSMIGWIQDKVRERETAGFTPAVSPGSFSASPTAMKHGATGKHPDDLEPALDNNGKQRHCPMCERPVYRKPGIARTGPNKGQPYVMIAHDKVYKDCEYKEYEG